ncbi:cytochrome b-c1 complex subunit 9 [Frankliniella occidentalis]|uniref:Complex III subunit 9 n=1 Tax=Frankliniella occidentalis TaxID=133901 RepID=A0A6J1TLY9_FRAOC|nr:cytochrome b-c1 complex subunit 9 [Frankliniella occidentalis]
MGIADMLFKRTSTMALTVIVGAFVFERSFDVLTNTIWDKINEGKQWKDIKKNYES